jgi:hypothetical protein
VTELPGPRVVLVGKPGCHLCDVAREVLTRVCSDLDEPWREASILDDPDLADRFWELIPVTLVDGEVLSHWTLDAGELRSAILGAATPGQAGRPRA